MSNLKDLEEIGVQYKIDVFCPNCNQVVQVSPVSRFVAQRTCPGCSNEFFVGAKYITAKTINDLSLIQNRFMYVDPEKELKVSYQFQIHIDKWGCFILTGFVAFIIYIIWGKS